MSEDARRAVAVLYDYLLPTLPKEGDADELLQACVLHVSELCLSTA